jgi:Sulfatase
MKKLFAENSDFLMATFDALRHDVAVEAHRSARTPFLARLVPQGWEERHSPGSFTYAAHAAFFAGFWPTPIRAGGRARPFALRFPGSHTTGPDTRVLDGANIVEGLRGLGYHTACVGGVGFFNKRNPLGCVFPRMFDESHWRPEFGVAQARSAREQVRQAAEIARSAPPDRPLFLFVNLSATHPPTRHYVRGAAADSKATQAAALAYVDQQLPPLLDALRARGRGGRAFLMSDHGTLFGEDGLVGHRVAHPAVWNVPYAEADWEPES